MFSILNLFIVKKRISKILRIFIQQIYIFKKNLDYLIFNHPLLIRGRYTSITKNNPLGSYQWINYHFDKDFNKKISCNYIIPSKFGEYLQLYTLFQFPSKHWCNCCKHK